MLKQFSVQNIYIGEYGWKPGSNTIAYYPLNGDAKDYSGNGRNLSGYLNYTSGGPGQVGVFGSGLECYYNNHSLFNSLTSFTYSVYVNPSSIASGTYTYGGYYKNSIITIYQYGTKSTHDKNLALCDTDGAAMYVYYNGQIWSKTNGLSTNQWYHLVGTWDGSYLKIYKNGVLGESVSCGGTYTGYSNATLLIGCSGDVSGTALKTFTGNLSNIIIENKAWTADEVSQYYNSTKSNYGL